MYKVTRILISEREKYSSFPIHLVKVRRNPIHEKQLCLENANRASKIDVLGSGTDQNEVVAGWLVHRFDPVEKVSEVVQHWWNFDPVKRMYFDTTPLDAEVEAWGFEYLLDDEILHVATTQLIDLEHTVGRDLVLTEDGWHTIEISDDNSAELTKLQDLSIKNLMHFENRGS